MRAAAKAAAAAATAGESLSWAKKAASGALRRRASAVKGQVVGSHPDVVLGTVAARAGELAGAAAGRASQFKDAAVERASGLSGVASAQFSNAADGAKGALRRRSDRRSETSFKAGFQPIIGENKEFSGARLAPTMDSNLAKYLGAGSSATNARATFYKLY